MAEILDFNSKPAPVAPDGPPHNTYKVYLRDVKEPFVAEGYLALTGAFFAVAQGTSGSDIGFVAPLEMIQYIVKTAPINTTVN